MHSDHRRFAFEIIDMIDTGYNFLVSEHPDFRFHFHIAK
jgi:hypothetical protein